MTIVLSICIPAYNRPILLKRALDSIISTSESVEKYVEIVVSDDSITDECCKTVNASLANWLGSWKYVRNSPRLGMANNWNHCIKIATGKYIMILHDDDFLIKNAVNNIIKTVQVQDFEEQYKVLLFGACVVNDQEKVIKKQAFFKRAYLSPEEALLKLMTNSSFVRFPAIVLHYQALKSAGCFDSTIGGVADLDMWIRLFSKFGVVCLPTITCAYTVHQEALTSEMFNQETIQKLIMTFNKVEVLQILGEKQLQKCQQQFFHQFILAGTIRYIRWKKFSQSYNVMKLFEIEVMRDLAIPINWLLLRCLLHSIFMVYKYLPKRESI